MKDAGSSVRAVLTVAAMAWMACARQAGAAEPDKLADLARYGVVVMDDVATPLLHHVATSTPYKLEVLAENREAGSLLPTPLADVRLKIGSGNEFVREEAMPRWSAYVQDQAAQLRQARAYLIPLETRWLQYDFARSTYAIATSMNRVRLGKSGPSYHCAGAFAVAPNRHYLTACLHALNEDEGDAFLRELRVEDRKLARDLRELGPNFRLMALARAEGQYRLLRGGEVSYTPVGGTYEAAGVQPVRITHLLLTDRGSGAIYVIAAKPGALAAPWDSGSAPATDSAVSASAQAAGPGPGWRLLANNGASSMYADAESRRREGGVAMLRTLFDMGPQGSSGVYSTVSWYEADCAKGTVQLVQNKGYAGRFGQGALMFDTADPQTADKPQKGSIGDALLAFACAAGPGKP